MRRQINKRMHHTENDYSSNINYAPMNGDEDDFLQMEHLPLKQTHRFENTIEAKVEAGDTLQALALRFHCTVADIKRLNKIDKDNEIYARKVVKIPVTVHSVLLGTLPTVHTSGNSSPKQEHNLVNEITRNPLEDARTVLNEKLLVASVNASNSNSSGLNNNVNKVVLNSKVVPFRNVYTDEVPQTISNGDSNDATLPLIADILDDESGPHMRHIPGPSMLTFDWSGSDCDMSWVCLFVVILALCFVIPLVYVIYLTENPHHHHNSTPISTKL